MAWQRPRSGRGNVVNSHRPSEPFCFTFSSSSSSSSSFSFSSSSTSPVPLLVLALVLVLVGVFLLVRSSFLPGISRPSSFDLTLESVQLTTSKLDSSRGPTALDTVRPSFGKRSTRHLNRRQLKGGASSDSRSVTFHWWGGPLRGSSFPEQDTCILHPKSEQGIR